MRQFFLLLNRALIATQMDGCLGVAKAAAYSGLLALFPVLTSITTILVQANASAVSARLAQFLFDVVPPGTEELIRQSVTVRGARPVVVIVVAALLSVWGASGLIASLMEGFQSVYKIPTGRPIVKQRLVAIMLVMATVLPAVFASALVLFGDNIERELFRRIGGLGGEIQVRGWVRLISKGTRYLLELATITGVMSVMYYFGPNRRQRWRNVWPGALLATALWLVTTLAFGWYVRNLAQYNVLYGSIGGVIAMLVWMYLLSAIALLGCEFNAERERLLKTQSVN
jgi:membrane protein